jgi:soluble lytic murein transglycosylase
VTLIQSAFQQRSRRRWCSLLLLAFVTTALAGPAQAEDKKPAKEKEAATQTASKLSSNKTSKTSPSQPGAAASARKTTVAKIIPLPRPRPKLVATASAPILLATAAPGLPMSEPPIRAITRPAPAPLAPAPAATTSAEDIATLRRAIGRAKRGDTTEATVLASGLSDPVARKLVEWVILRSDNNGVDFGRYAAFINANPGWPSIGMFRRRAEAMLWVERAAPQTIRKFFDGGPLSAKGRFSLARALLAQGDRAGAQAQVREAWRNDAFGADTEDQALAEFRDFITRADDKARMERRLYGNDNETALKVAQRLGGADLALARARVAVNRKTGNAKALLDAVPESARSDAGYIYVRAQLLRRADEISEAGRLMLTAPREASQIHDLDEWWVERRLLTRKLLDIGDAKTAYLIARDAVPPMKENYRIEHQFTAGWIALRFLHDPRTAITHFARINELTDNPTSLGRAGYWLGRAFEEMGRNSEARAHYEAAARHSTSYYGQLARARLGLPDIPLAPAPPTGAARGLEVVHAAELLYAVDEKTLVIPYVADLADRLPDPTVISALGEVTAQNQDPRAMLLVGKNALNRGLPLDHYAFPAIGVPRVTQIGPEVEPALVYSIIRQESAFNPGDVSTAQALGLMQVTPEAGRYICKKYGCSYDRKRLLTDKAYNVQVGSAELGGNIEDYRGSLIMAFAGYNAGRGRVKEWVERYGDPRDPSVDPIDWVERIPFSETRNYVQRIVENLQVYRARFGNHSKLMIEADLHRGAPN